jgi:uncharacterized cupin superfamily protein
LSQEARLERAESGLVPVTDGWFVVNVRDAAWLSNEAFGLRAVFEGSGPALRGRPDLQGHRFDQIGLTLAVLLPGKPSGLYHSDSRQEDFLVLSGECTAIVEDEERRLQEWDCLHCPPGTGHVFVGTGPAPCAILMVGGRTHAREVLYPHSDVASCYGASAQTETWSATDAYAPFPEWEPSHEARASGAELLQPAR